MEQVIGDMYLYRICGEDIWYPTLLLYEDECFADQIDVITELDFEERATNYSVYGYMCENPHYELGVALDTTYYYERHVFDEEIW